MLANRFSEINPKRTKLKILAAFVLNLKPQFVRYTFSK